MNQENERKLLQQRIKELNDAYYKGEALVSDEEFDILFSKLKELEKEDGLTNTVNSPDLKGTLYKHGIPMLSLQTEIDSSKEGLINFITNKFTTFSPSELEKKFFVAQYKMDGLGINIQYEKGHLKRLLTRGDGEQGEDVTHALELFRSTVPGYINTPDQDLVEIRGEAMLSNAEFRDLNIFLESNSQQTRSNPRNAVAGIIRTHDPSRYPNVRLEFFPYGFGFTQSEISSSESEFLEFVLRQGFTVKPWFSKLFVAKDISEGYDFFLKAAHEKQSSQANYLADGVVYKLNSFVDQKTMGFRSREPRWAMAQKFEPSSKQSKLLGVTFEIGRTGKITPVGHVLPTDIDGVVVSKATLHNVFDIRRRNVRVGDEISIYRAGDTIPEIGYRPKTPVRNNYLPNIRITKQCPSCNSFVSRPKGEANYYCTNTVCKAKLRAALGHFAGRTAMDIKGVGPEIIDRLVTEEHLKSYSDFFTLQKFELTGVGVAPSNADKILVEIASSLENDDWRFLSGIGIRYIGTSTSKSICRTQPLEKFPDLTYEELIQIPEVDKKTALSVLGYFSNPTNKDIFKFMWWYVGCNFKSTLLNKKGKLLNCKVSFSGTFPTETRRDFLEEIVEREGGKVVKEVGKDTKFFVVGENPTVRKLEKAKTFNVTVFTPKEFLEFTKV